jgi:formylglycine-generating enzyme required for sulfatase activity
MSKLSGFQIAVIVVVLLACCGLSFGAVIAYRRYTSAGREERARPPAVATRVREIDGAVEVFVPAGEFTMGSEDGMNDERPVRRVYLDAFWIDETEVTNAQYEGCVVAGKCRASGCADDAQLNDGRQPVVCVDWSDAEAYCRWAAARLPTEAEWEKAARGTDGRTYPWGNEPATCEYAVMDDGSGSGCGQHKPWPVGSKPRGAGPYGTLDMAGNAWEWVADWYDSGYYARSPGRNPGGPDSGEARVLRGGPWPGGQYYVRCANRVRIDPAYRGNFVGFRCAGS